MVSTHEAGPGEAHTVNIKIYHINITYDMYQQHEVKQISYLDGQHPRRDAAGEEAGPRAPLGEFTQARLAATVGGGEEGDEEEVLCIL